MNQNNEKKLIFATKNAGKVREIKEILKDTGYEVLSLNDIDIDIEIEENGTTFEENALIKAEAIRDITHTMVLADDSGLEVDYLDKAPGIYSARYLGVETPQSEKNQHIIDHLQDVEDLDRTCRFVCSVACAMTDGTSWTVRGTIEGIVARKCAGEHGFGYDPIFYVPQFERTMAELDMDEKNQISHRGSALRQMKDKLQELGLI